MASSDELNYQDPDAIEIDLWRADREAFAVGVLPGFTEVACIDGGQFRDRICYTTICVRESDESYWSMQWSAEIDSLCNDDYDMHHSIVRIKPVQIGLNKQIVDWVREKA